MSPGAPERRRTEQDEVTDAIRAAATVAPQRGGHPDRAYAPYRSTNLRAPAQPLVVATPSLLERAAPVFGAKDVAPTDADLTVQSTGEPLGERIVVTGRVLDGDGRPVRNQLVEVWQANASGRYRHDGDRHPAPLDPHFVGGGRCLTDDDGRYRFVTIKPGAYPWRNHHNAWRPAHIHFSLFGTAFTQRLVTQMYFPGDQLFHLDPIFSSVTDEKAQQRLVARYDHDTTVAEWALGYQWDIVLDGPGATPPDPDEV
ncbi:protocatechuate 3,4-dioxygenase subunit beta [Actinomycetospora sp. CA-084318]|uniref:protocatechuate 3,4-dioxygenase subunit beta n=1 Tax=Actinomycetospora sp. CA-084318 TaxID=3239892 RepID=UPI003D98B221